MGNELWEFNPSRTETRNGLAPLAWRRLPDLNRTVNRRLRLTGATPLPNGGFFVANGPRTGVFDPIAGDFTYHRDHPDHSFGTTIYDATRDTAYAIYNRVFLAGRNAPSPAQPFQFPLAQATLTPAFLSGASGLAVDKRGNLLGWSGRKEVMRYDVAANRWRVYFHKVGPSGDGRVFNKWVYVESDDVFVGITDWLDGPWVYKLPPGEGALLSPASAQSFVDAAAPGSSVTVPPGTYPGGLRIAKPLTVNLKGVTLTGIVDRKGVILVDNTPGPVTIEEFETTLAPNAHSNIAGLRIQGGGDVALRRSRIAFAEMGILTGNEGTGKLTVEESVIEEIGGGGLSHGIYFGVGDTLVVRNTTVRRGHNNGHLIKSRARKTVIDRVRALALDGNSSRELEFPCGGDIAVTGSVVQKGPDTDNAESIAVNIESAKALGNAGNCGANDGQATRFAFRGNWLIFDRTGLPPERQHAAGANEFGKWRALPPDTPIEVSGNSIVGLKSWGEFPDLSAANKMYADRAAAGLEPGEIPRLP
jgi:hypothetical protein